MQNPFYGLNIGNVLHVCRDYELFKQTEFANQIQLTINEIYRNNRDAIDEFEISKLMSIDAPHITRLINHERKLAGDLRTKTFCSIFIPYIKGKIGSFEAEVCTGLLNELQRLMWSDTDIDPRIKQDMKQEFESFCHTVDSSRNIGSPNIDVLQDIFDKVFRRYVSYSLVQRKNNQANDQQRQEYLEQEKLRVSPPAIGFVGPAPQNEALTDAIKNMTRRDNIDPALIDQIARCLGIAKRKKPIQENELNSFGITLPAGHMAEGMRIPYIEWYGSGESGVSEYRYGHNITLSAERKMIDVSELIPDFIGKYKEQEEASVKLGYPKISVDKLRLNAIKAEYDLAGGSAYKLEISFEAIDYFTAQILRNYLTQKDSDGKLKPEGRKLYLDTLPRRGEEVKPGMIWPLCGCGVWLITNDNMIIFSRRTTVLELPSNLGYSAAGSCEYTDRLMERNAYRELGLEANPFKTAQRETNEETNTPFEHLILSNFSLISLGVDLPRCLVQFSFMVHLDLNARDVLEYYKAGAKSAHEQIICALPMRRDVLLFVLKNFEMEPGAVYSLIHIMEKNRL